MFLIFHFYNAGLNILVQVLSTSYSKSFCRVNISEWNLRPQVICIYNSFRHYQIVLQSGHSNLPSLRRWITGPLSLHPHQQLVSLHLYLLFAKLAKKFNHIIAFNKRLSSYCHLVFLFCIFFIVFWFFLMGYLYFFFVGVLYVIWILIFMGYMCYKYLLLVCDVSIFMSFKHFFHFNVIEIINFFFLYGLSCLLPFTLKKNSPVFLLKIAFDFGSLSGIHFWYMM